MAHVDERCERLLSESEQAWLGVRSYLVKHRHELGVTAAAELSRSAEGLRLLWPPHACRGLPPVFRQSSRRRPVTVGHSRTDTERPLTAFVLVRGRSSRVAGVGFEPT